MEAGKAQISTVFNGSRLLEIPFYQRAYVWGGGTVGTLPF